MEVTAFIFAAAKDIALAVAAIVTATVAVRGLNKWREELRGKVDFETARGLVRATYKLRDEIQSARAPLIRGSEFPDTCATPEKNTPQEEAQRWAHVYGKRWEPVAKALQEFDAQALEAEALWGAEIRDPTQALRRCAHELFVAIETIIEDKASGGQNFASDRGFAKQVRADVYGSSTDQNNPLSTKIMAAIDELEAKLRAHLRRS